MYLNCNSHFRFGFLILIDLNTGEQTKKRGGGSLILRLTIIIVHACHVGPFATEMHHPGLFILASNAILQLRDANS